ncbi:MAG TPA: leucyl/phenylalanyl-tRNA--protein transferase [Lacipirellulaceae bacterium]
MAREPHSVDDLLVPADVIREPMPADIGLSTPRFFPPPTATTPEGLLCVGGRLAPNWLLDAYSHGIFPWPMWENEPIVWWSPDPRAIFELNAFHISRRLARTLRSGRFTATSDRDFGSVIRGCATATGRRGNTWLTPAMIEAYCRMHASDHAHSVEVWQENRLVGGTYGIAIGGLFAAESMFYRVRDASKVALAHLVAHLDARGYQLFDIQQWTPHTGSLGAIEISRDEYLRRLARVIDLPVAFGKELCGEVTTR